MAETEQSTALTIGQRLNESVSALSQKNANGFEMAYFIADGIDKLSALLTPEYMKPIMKLQGNKLGFKSDKTYTEDVVKNCLIEAVLSGVQPFGNQFNIIAGNMYITKEGYGELLKKIIGLTYDIVFELPRINTEKTSAAIEANITWSLGGETKEKKIPIPVRMNVAMGTDAVIGKATRKARAWLYSTITGTEFSDGDASDPDSATRQHSNFIVQDDPNAQSAKDAATDMQNKFIGEKKGGITPNQDADTGKAVDQNRPNTDGVLDI